MARVPGAAGCHRPEFGRSRGPGPTGRNLAQAVAESGQRRVRLVPGGRRFEASRVPPATDYQGTADQAQEHDPPPGQARYF
ncbi:hypothetical protein AC249_AIPGENE380, partial [Exaiptasia diaphana]